LKFCPRCGNAVLPDKKFCTTCGASLTPDLPGAAGSPDPVPSGLGSKVLLIAAAGIVVVILGIVLVIYPVLTGSGILSAVGIAATPAPTPVITPADSGSSSYVEVMTETMAPQPVTPVITATTVIPTTEATTVITTYQTFKKVICTSDQVKCNGKCADLMTDSANCGYCGTACPSGQFCQMGACMPTCSASQTSCPGGCFNLQTDSDHCGTCGNNCPAGLICSNGLCTAPATPQLVPV
jgi:hypothetical protein